MNNQGYNPTANEKRKEKRVKRKKEKKKKKREKKKKEKYFVREPAQSTHVHEEAKMPMFSLDAIIGVWPLQPYKWSAEGTCSSNELIVEVLE